MQKKNKMAAHNQLGKEGEDAAACYLISHGYLIKDRNWRAKRYELDIVAEKNHTLIVIEVKTRASNCFGEPEEAISAQKIRHIVTSTDAYLKKYQIDLPVQFDVITVIGHHPPFKIKHIEEAFLPPVW